MKKKVLKIMSLNTLVLYVLCYLIKTFVIWELTNPFQWILDLPVRDETYRVMTLLSIFAWTVFNAIISTAFFINFGNTKEND